MTTIPDAPAPNEQVSALARFVVAGFNAALFEAPVLLGLAAIAYGAWLWFPPAGYIAGGALIVCWRVLMVYSAAIADQADAHAASKMAKPE